MASKLESVMILSGFSPSAGATQMISLELSGFSTHIMLAIGAPLICLSNHPMLSVTPDSCRAKCEIFVGLIMQYHYVGLDKLPVCGVQQSIPSMSEQANDNSENAPVADESLDDATIEEGDDFHTEHISNCLHSYVVTPGSLS